MGPPCCCPGSGRAESICACYIPPLCLSAPIWVTLMVWPGERSQSLLAAGQGWWQLHHGSSLQPPCGCSLPAQPASLPAQAHPGLSSPWLKLIPAQARHVLVAFAEAVARWCVIRPCLRAGGSSNLAPLHLWSCLKYSGLKHSFSKLPGLQGKEHGAILQSTWQTRPERSWLPPQSLHLSWTVQLWG